MIKNVLSVLLLLIGFQITVAQSVSGRIIDSETGVPLSFADVQINDSNNIMSNTEGAFTIPEKSADDATMLTVSFLGYYTQYLTVRDLKNSDGTVRLKPGAFELETVYISNASMNADSIMASVKSNLKNNYRFYGSTNKTTFFYRSSAAINPVKAEAKISQSTKYSKEEIKEANKELEAFISVAKANPPKEFADVLIDHYMAKKMVKGKMGFLTRDQVTKAVKLKDNSSPISLNDMLETGAKILFTHLDPEKYYRIKSGWFGTRDTVVSHNSFDTDEVKTEKSNLRDVTSEISLFKSGNNLLYSSNLDFVKNNEIYDYTFAGVTEDGNNGRVFIIKFRPGKHRAKYNGTLYIAEKDYAVVRADYGLAEGRKVSGINLKFILGVKQQENVSRGTLVFKEREEGGYYLKYASKESGEYVYINRPLKFIEITNGGKEKIEFEIKVEMNILNRQEFCFVSKSAITEAEFDAVEEKDFDYETVNGYSPDIWKEYTTIEPLEEMKQFKSVAQ
ncbi:carboxypeptidase-like regulatory domain-containing protein [Flavobacterium rakeshii]|uniref:Carboxypeptidase-like regulatory domain-containing protein n=1 Tax=Flavobacterium rakeshii TaxID=1038845 RepID=A0A6N8HCN5_9FLAO|nr:carboxypeptidase-like regulatory domain-containing protein [Flavobacterium rakeshii]MUV02996.1 carboxypeptidase-like regulatory domain-containing protein [Flavobacterium rakeshii]